jgi:fluoride exporter
VGGSDGRRASGTCRGVLAAAERTPLDLTRLASIAAGGAIGTAARLAIGAVAPGPATLLAINVVGALLLGWWWGGAEAGRVPGRWTPLIATGALGSFTTFSALAQTTLEAGGAGVAYGLASVTAGGVAAAAGFAWGARR